MIELHQGNVIHYGVLQSASKCFQALCSTIKAADVVDEPMLTISTPKSKGSYTPPFQVDQRDSFFISFKSQILQSRLFSPFTKLFAPRQGLSDLPLKPLPRQYAALGDLGPFYYRNAHISFQRGAMQGCGSPIATTCQAEKPSVPRKRAAFSYNATIALYGINKFSGFNNRPQEDITPCETLPSIFSPLFQDEMRESADRRILSIEHTRAEYRPNCRLNLHRRQRNARRFRDITRHYHPLHNSTIRRIVRHRKPAHKPEPCQVTLYITVKITHHGVRSPCDHPLADARSVK